MSRKKGLDSKLVHYGIREDDLLVLEKLAEKYNLDWDWVQEDILKKYHEKKTNDEITGERDIIKLIEAAVARLEV
jgi:hypothetical protein